MIILYLRGQISDEHFACGLMADAGKCPPISQFERIGAIMSGVSTVRTSAGAEQGPGFFRTRTLLTAP